MIIFLGRGIQIGNYKRGGLINGISQNENINYMRQDSKEEGNPNKLMIA